MPDVDADSRPIRCTGCGSTPRDGGGWSELDGLVSEGPIIFHVKPLCAKCHQRKKRVVDADSKRRSATLHLWMCEECKTILERRLADAGAKIRIWPEFRGR